MGSQSEFQNQFSLLMSKLLHSTVTEATKLFEKTVQEMIAELARIRKQNEVLKDNLFDFEDDVPASSNRLACSKRDVGVQCDAPPPAPKEDPPPLPPTPLQNAKKEEEFALVFVKKEESDTYDETQACIFARISADQPRQMLVQHRDGGGGGGGETSSVQQASLIPRQVLVQQCGGGETSTSVQQSSLIPKQLLVQQRDGETTLESNLSIVKLAAFQATRDRPTVTLTRLTSSELSAAQNGTLTLSQPKVTAVALTTTTTTTTPQKPNGTVSWTQHQGTLTLIQPTAALAVPSASSASPLLPVAKTQPLLIPKTEPEECELHVEESGDVESTGSRPSSGGGSSSSVSLKRSNTRQRQGPTPRYRQVAQVNDGTPTLTLPNKYRQMVEEDESLLLASAAEGLPEAEEVRQRNQCDVCDRVLSSSVALDCHRKIHSGERPWVCESCGKGFPDGRGLRRHLHIHNPRRHQCKECGKTFVYVFQLRNHQVIHTSEYAFECKVCGKGFKSKSTLVTHMYLHTGEKPFQCSFCFKRFRHRMSFNTHVQRHRGEKRYVCLTCKKPFSDPNNLKAHKRVHTGERPYKCTSCDKKFKQSAHLKKHIATQH